jgi:hypothetical protein
MSRIIPFKVDHLDVMDMRAHEAALCKDKQRMELLALTGDCVTGMHNGRVMCVGGINKYDFGVANIWLVPSIYIHEASLEFSKAVKRWLREKVQGHHIRRTSSDCIDDDLHNRWMEFLGFEREGYRKNYIGDTNYVMWGKLWE